MNRPTSITHETAPANDDWIAAEMEATPHRCGWGVVVNGEFYGSADHALRAQTRRAHAAGEKLAALIARGARP